MKGRRVMPNAEGWLPNLEPGDYGRCVSVKVAYQPILGWWQLCAPDGAQCSVNPEIHKIVEHADGTITISPSIDFSKIRPGGYHGYLVAGEWNP